MTAQPASDPTGTEGHDSHSAFGRTPVPDHSPGGARPSLPVLAANLAAVAIVGLGGAVGVRALVSHTGSTSLPTFPGAPPQAAPGGVGPGASAPLLRAGTAVSGGRDIFAVGQTSATDSE